MNVESCMSAAGVPSFWHYLLHISKLFESKQDCSMKFSERAARPRDET